jgi:hypothetical protein
MKQKNKDKLLKAARRATRNKKTALEFLKSAGIVDENNQLAEKYR